MKVKVHPHRTRYLSENEEYSRLCISVTPEKKNGRAYYMATVMLKDVSFRVHSSGVKEMEKTGVRNVHAWIVGDLVEEYTIAFQPTARLVKFGNLRKVRYDFENGQFVFHDTGESVTDSKFNAAYIVGRDVYVGAASKVTVGKKEE